MGKKPKADKGNKRRHNNRKKKRAKHTRKKYSSEDELSASFDQDDEIDFNVRANLVGTQPKYARNDRAAVLQSAGLTDSSKSSDASS
jgi:hypothetical protein